MHNIQFRCIEIVVSLLAFLFEILFQFSIQREMKFDVLLLTARIQLHINWIVNIYTIQTVDASNSPSN